MTVEVGAHYQLTSIVGIDKIRVGAEENIDISIRALDEHYGLAEKIKRCAALLVEHLSADAIDERRAVSRTQFFLVFHKQSVLAFLGILRGHVTEAYANLRVMIEAALFAALIEKEPKRLLTWIEAGDLENRSAYDAFKKEFASRKMWQLGDHRTKKLLDRFDILAKHTHTSIVHLSRSLKIERPAGSHEFQFRFFEYAQNDPTDLRQNWLYAVEANIEVLDLFASWLPSAATSSLWLQAFDDLKREFTIAEAIWESRN